jgi:hypothetical protein
MSTKKPYQLSYGEVVFNNLPAPTSCGSPKVDPPTGGIIISCPMLPGAPYSTYFTQLSAAGFQLKTWANLLTFSYSISATQFQAALNAAKTSMPTATFSTRPKDYSLTEWHANDELNNYEKGRALLGVTTKGVTIELQ